MHFFFFSKKIDRKLWDMLNVHSFNGCNLRGARKPPVGFSIGHAAAMLSGVYCG